MKRKKTVFIYIAVILLLLSQPCLGIVFETDENVHISNLHKIEDDLFIWGSNVTVDGIIEGDLFTGGYKITTNGHTKMSENIFGYEFRHTGKIDGALRAFVNSCSIDGYIGRSVLIFGNDININKTTVIEKDAILAGNTIYYKGHTRGNVQIYGNKVFITGITDGDLTIEAEKIQILPPAVINGNLNYTCNKEADIDLTSGVIINGETTWELPEIIEEYSHEASHLTGFILSISKFLAAFLFGVILLYIFKKYIVESVTQLRTRFAIATATGLLSLIIFGLCIVILTFSLVFIIVGLILISGNLALVGALVLALSILMIPITSFATVTGGVIFYSGKIVIALLIGYFLIKLIKPPAAVISRWQLFIGLIILTGIFSLPYVGFLFYIIFSIIGAGGIILGIKNCRPGLN